MYDDFYDDQRKQNDTNAKLFSEIRAVKRKNEKLIVTIDKMADLIKQLQDRVYSLERGKGFKGF